MSHPTQGDPRNFTLVPSEGFDVHVELYLIFCCRLHFSKDTAGFITFNFFGCTINYCYARVINCAVLITFSALAVFSHAWPVSFCWSVFKILFA